MHHEIGAVRQRPAQVWCCKRVVDDQLGANVTRNRSAAIDVANLQQRVRDRLSNDDSRLQLPSLGVNLIEIGQIQEGGFDSKGRQHFDQEIDGRAVEIL